MKRSNFNTMSTDELWLLREKIGSLLVKKVEAEKRELQKRLDELDRKFGNPADAERQRRPHPKVYPKFQNPKQPSQTWTGRGKQPHWVRDLLEAGMSIDDLRISSAIG
jgi:DNA-binding protein H-NS